MIATPARQNGNGSASCSASELVDIGNTGRSLDPEIYPGVGAKFSLRDSRTYQALRATAQAYLEAIGPVKAAFVEREYPVDFDEKLAQLIADFDEATQDTDAGPAGTERRHGRAAGGIEPRAESGA
jgi:hypothetical protein